MFLIIITKNKYSTVYYMGNEKYINFASPYVYIKKSTIDGAGYGVFAGKAFKKEEDVEIVPFIEIDNTNDAMLSNYVFQSHLHPRKNILAFGYGSMYNHSPDNNVDYFKHTDRTMIFKANRAIAKGDELFINYGPNHSVNIKN